MNLKYQLINNPEEVYYISKFLHESEEEANPKIIGAMVELLENDYLQNASYENIKEVFELLIVIQDKDIDWENAIEINDALEVYF